MPHGLLPVCTTPAEAIAKVCRKCGISQPLERFPFRKAEQCYRNTCKACRAAESYALRHHPEHGAIIRERERQRSQRRRPAIRAWERAHPDNLRPGQQRRRARQAAKRAAARRAAYRPLLAPFRAVLPPDTAPPGATSTPRGGRGSKSSADSLPRP